MKLQPMRRLGNRALVAIAAACATAGVAVTTNAAVASSTGDIPSHLIIKVQIVGWPCVNIRTGPSAGSRSVRCAPTGTWFTVECQRSGGFNGGDYLWDRIMGTNLYVSDWWVSNTGWGVSDPNLAGC